MAGGDLLYIFAFIILPTAVLVSCIWALIMLRNGALLPPRPVVTREIDPAADDAAYDEMNVVEETGEHVIVEPATAAKTAAAPSQIVPATVDETSPTAKRADDTDVAGSPFVASPSHRRPPHESPMIEAPVNETPPVERTQELGVVPEGVAEPADAQREAATAGEPTMVVGVDAPRVAETPPADQPDGVLIVPLDEPGSWSGTQTETPTGQEPTESAGGAPEAPPLTATTPRRPPRRVAQLRPTEAEPTRPRPRSGQRRGERRAERE